MHDEAIFSNPEVFLPERHLGVVTNQPDASSAPKSEKAYTYKDKDPSELAFGYGRRFALPPLNVTPADIELEYVLAAFSQTRTSG